MSSPEAGDPPSSHLGAQSGPRLGKSIDPSEVASRCILTEIDVQATLKAKLDQSFRKYVILGACSPQLAHRALEAELGIGLLLPCNVCVWEEENGSVVSIARPQAMFDLVRKEALQPVVDDADQRLRRALEAAQTMKAT